MKLSFDDNESFKEAVESLRFNNPSGDPNASLQIESSITMPLDFDERNEDNISPSELITVQRVGSSSSIQDIRRSGDSSFFW